MDETEMLEILEKQGIVLVRSEDGIILGIKRVMLDKLLAIADEDEDEAVFMLIEDADEAPPADDKMLN
jgi:hypothetical protein